MTSHEELSGFACEDCGNAQALCTCRRCKCCRDYYPADDMHYGLCPDCFDDFDSADLEDKLERAMNP